VLRALQSIAAARAGCSWYFDVPIPIDIVEVRVTDRSFFVPLEHSINGFTQLR
jgi:hypothetical protein